MPCTLAVEATDAGPVVVKQASGADAASLRAEGERLQAAAHPGVVVVIASSGTDTSWELRLAHGGRPVDTLASLSAHQVAALVAGAAATLADLHGAGIVHGHLGPAHVLVGSHGRPVLCGFGPSAGEAQPADDVAALGALIVSLLGTEPDGGVIPERRWMARRSSAVWARRTLLVLADQASAEPPTRRPSARRLAASIAEAFPAQSAAAQPAAAHADPLEPVEQPLDPLDALRATAEPPPGRRPASLPSLAGALVGVALLGVGVLRLARPDTGVPFAAERSPAHSTTFLPTTSTTDTGTSPAPELAAAIVDGTTVRVGPQRFEVGDPGDLVVVGDWDCDGSATPALLRPSTGEVFVFPRWAGDTEVVVTPVARIAGAVELVADEGADGCVVLAAQLADGSRVELPEAVGA